MIRRADRSRVGTADVAGLTAISPSRNGRRRRWLTLPACACLVLFCSVIGAGLAHAATGDGWRWPRYDNHAVKIRVVVDSGFDRGLLPQLKDAAKAWNSTGDLRLELQKKPVPSCDTQQPQTICVSTTIPEVCGTAGGCSNNYGDTTAQDGLRLISYAVAWYNPAYNWAGDWWAREVFCHELGHTIGLGHTEQGPPSPDPSCMSYNNYTDHPSTDDLALVHSLYAVRDTR